MADDGGAGSAQGDGSGNIRIIVIIVDDVFNNMAIFL
jgi:hypothetical protein